MDRSSEKTNRAPAQPFGRATLRQTQGERARPPAHSASPFARSPSRRRARRWWGDAVRLVALLAAASAVAMASTQAYADHEKGKHVNHCAFMHSHPSDDSDHGETTPGYEQHNGYVHCHDESHNTGTGTGTGTGSTGTGSTVGGTGGGGGGGGGGFGGGGPGGNQAPLFALDVNVIRSVDENSRAGTVVGGPVTATDPENDRLRYRLIGADRGMFNIDHDTGQITVARGTALDYEGERNVYSVRVVALDVAGSGGSNEVAVAVHVGDVKLPGKADAYDVAGNHNEVLDLAETLAAVRDYFAGRLTLEDILFIVRYYFRSYLGY